MKKYLKSMLSCTLAVLCTANAVSFASGSAAEPAALNAGYAYGAAASEGKFTASDYAAERGTVKHLGEMRPGVLRFMGSQRVGYN